MDALASADMLLFEAFGSTGGRGLFRQDEDGACVRSPSARGPLLCSISSRCARNSALEGRDHAAAWPETVVEDNNLTVQISAFRRILDRGRAEGSCIQTVAGRGYRFVAPVMRANPPPRREPLRHRATA